MKALVLTSQAPRHRAYCHSIANHFDLSGIITEQKKNYYTQAREQSKLVRTHFEKLASTEKDYFGDPSYPDTEHLESNDINDAATLDWATHKNVNAVFLFGTRILSQQWLDAFPGKIFNLHLGLSPFFRGSATLFWPFYEKKLECVGVTLHLAVKEVDAGSIISRFKPEIKQGDNYYTITNQAIKVAIDKAPLKVIDYINGNTSLVNQDLSLGNVYKKKDFNEEKLRSMLEYIGNGITAEQIQHIKESKLCSCSQ